jgi:DHA1 family inner membrane transport protein
MKGFPVPLLALALSAFAIGTTEFVIMGLLPQVASNLAVSIPAAGWLVSGYALGVLIGAPVMAIATQKLPPRAALMVLMGIFILGNALCAIAPSYGFSPRCATAPSSASVRLKPPAWCRKTSAPRRWR